MVLEPQHERERVACLLRPRVVVILDSQGSFDATLDSGIPFPGFGIVGLAQVRAILIDLHMANGGHHSAVRIGRAARDVRLPAPDEVDRFDAGFDLVHAPHAPALRKAKRYALASTLQPRAYRNRAAANVPSVAWTVRARSIVGMPRESAKHNPLIVNRPLPIAGFGARCIMPLASRCSIAPRGTCGD